MTEINARRRWLGIVVPMRWMLVLMLLVVACDKQGPSSRAPAPKSKPPAAAPAPSEGEEEKIVPPPDNPGYAKPE